jgi:hypothetical protein
VLEGMKDMHSAENRGALPPVCSNLRLTLSPVHTTPPHDYMTFGSAPSSVLASGKSDRSWGGIEYAPDPAWITGQSGMQPPLNIPDAIDRALVVIAEADRRAALLDDLIGSLRDARRRFLTGSSDLPSPGPDQG